MELLIILYIVAQFIAAIKIGYKLDQISNSLLNDISLLHLILGILFLPAIIIDVLTVLVGLGLESSKDWFIKKVLFKLQNIKIYKFK